MLPMMRPGRVVGLDVARALALFGMMATHILPEMGPDGVTLSHQVAGGRSSALFAVLAGVSLGLMSGRTAPQRGRTRTATAAGLAARAVLIGFIGVLLGLVDSGIAVILPYYGVLFLLAVPFLGLRARSLFTLGAVWVVVGPVLSHLLRPHLPAPTLDSSLNHPWEMLTELTFTGYYPAVPWLAFALIGLGLARIDLSRASTAGALAAVGSGVALLSWAASATLLALPGVWETLGRTFSGPGREATLELTLDSGLYGTTPTGSWWWLAVRAAHTGTPFDFAHTIGTSLLVIGLCVLAGRVAPRLLTVLFGAGAMTLTLYSAHVLARTEGWWDGDDLATYVGQVLVALAVGALYALARRRGPLERAVGKAQSAVSQAVAASPPR
jgi:hypothetical protein